MIISNGKYNSDFYNSFSDKRPLSELIGCPTYDLMRFDEMMKLIR